ncbi:MAG: hypothetical protein IIW88_03370 [Clostridia bacterium]|nr:hypothetical protein [Clostridia bacterium]
MELINFSRPMDKDSHPEKPTLLARYLTHQTINADGKVVKLTAKDQECKIEGELHSLKLNW